MVFAYGGAMIFPEMMAEMRRPRDFIKGIAIAQLLIFSCYLMYGIFVYCFQGQCPCFFFVGSRTLIAGQIPSHSHTKGMPNVFCALVHCN